MWELEEYYDPTAEAQWMKTVGFNIKPNSPTSIFGYDFGFNMIDDFLASQFEASLSSDLFYRRPRCFGCLWVFWTDGTNESKPPTTNPGIREKISNVLQHLEFSYLDSVEYVLVQFWAPVTTGDRCFLSTLDQPFGISIYNEELCAFRNLSQGYQFYVDTELEKELSIISRVFAQKSPKLIPYVQTCSSIEYLQLDHVGRCNVHTTLALPVLEPTSLSCVGVIELVLPRGLTDRYDYVSLILQVCDKLKAVDLKSSFDSDHFESLNVTPGQELEEDSFLSKAVKTFVEKSFGSIQIDQATKSQPRTEGLQNGGMMQIDSSFQRVVNEDDAINHGNDVIIGEDDAINNGNDVIIGEDDAINNVINGEDDAISNGKDVIIGEDDAINNGNNVLIVEDDAINNDNATSNLIATPSKQEVKRKPSDRGHRKTEIPISYEVLEQHFRMKLEDAAKKLGVSRSTLKRLCRQHEISWWPYNKRKKVNNRSLSKPPPKPAVTPADTTIEDVKIATIKATYKDEIIKFQLSFSSGVADLEEEVRKRLKLEIGTFRVKYKDEDGDWISIACDADLKNCMPSSTSLANTTLRLSVQLVTIS